MLEWVWALEHRNQSKGSIIKGKGSSCRGYVGGGGVTFIWNGMAVGRVGMGERESVKSVWESGVVGEEGGMA